MNRQTCKVAVKGFHWCNLFNDTRSTREGPVTIRLTAVINPRPCKQGLSSLAGGAGMAYGGSQDGTKHIEYNAQGCTCRLHCTDRTVDDLNVMGLHDRPQDRAKSDVAHMLDPGIFVPVSASVAMVEL